MDIHRLEHIDLSTSLTLAIMATLGYVFGTLAQRRKGTTNELLLRMKQDLSRAQMAVNELRKVLTAVSSSTAKHNVRLKQFQNRIAKLGTRHDDAIWHELCQEVAGVLDPTLDLVGEIANAQERMRCQGNYLMTFSEARTDPLTGLGNRRTLDHVLSTHFSLLTRYDAPFSLAVVDIDDFKNLNDKHGHLHGDQVLRDFTGLLTETLRAVDILSRYGGDEFVVVMPQTDLAGAGMLGERLRASVEQQMPFSISVGVASADRADTPESLFQRADAALYRAKTDGRNRTVCDPPLLVEAVAMVENATPISVCDVPTAASVSPCDSST
jgi:diguanylate cyclase (GGDEF)-like protein